MSKKHRIILILIVIFSFLIRFRHLDSNPLGFFCDEASAGVDAASILKTGQDQHGEKFPLFFKGFNYDNVGPYEIYPIIPFIKLFGLNETAVRLPGVVGSGLEIIIFFFILCHFIPPSFALIGSFFFSISPWYFYNTRMGMGGYYSWSLLTSLSLLFLIKAEKGRKIHYYLFSLFIAMACYSYSPSRVISPLFFLLTVALLVLKKKIKTAIICLFIFSIILIPFTRFHLTDPHSFNRIKETVGIDFNKKEISNEAIILPQKFIKKYLLHFSDQFLFTSGDADFPGQFIRRHSIIGTGLFYPFQRVTMIIGLIWLVSELIKTKKISTYSILFLLLFFSVPDTLTLPDTPYSTRSHLGVIPLSLISSVGTYSIYILLKKHLPLKKKFTKFLFFIMVIFLATISFKSLLTNFDKSILSNSDYWGWQYGPRDIIKYFSENESNYDQLIMTGSFNGANIFFPFYAPNNCQKCILGQEKDHNPEISQLFALRPEEVSLNSSLIDVKKTLFYPNNTPAFIIFEIK